LATASEFFRWPLHVFSALRRRVNERILVLMATQPISEKPRSGRLISVEEYLSTGYEPDCEYEDGVIVERNVGEFEHSFLQAILATLFTNKMDDWGVFALTEQRVQVTPSHFLVPDLCVLSLGEPTEDILTHPPLIAIEIMSPEDTLRRATKKAQEYIRFGIENVWLIDPNARVAYRGGSKGLERVPGGELAVSGTSITIQISDLFARLDKIRATGQR
jgi:Uma2 family endonuclease